MSRSLLWGMGDLRKSFRAPIPDRTITIRDTLTGELGLPKHGTSAWSHHKPASQASPFHQIPTSGLFFTPTRRCLPLQRLWDLVP